MTRVSVVMTTYNGEQFLIDQLDSIRKQTRKPDEVLIFDDRSSDNTYGIACEYIKEHSLINWKVSKNKENLGWKKNFVYAMKQSSGDYVFLADQDDIWNLDKIESMTNIMEKNENILLLAGNCEIIYSQDVETEKLPPFYSSKERSFYLDGIWNNRGIIGGLNKKLKEEKHDTGNVLKFAFDTGLFNSQRQGCVMCMRHELIENALNYWNPECPHDTVLWFYAAAHDGLYLYERNVIKYRHHSSNAGFEDTLGSGLNASSEKKKIQDQIKQIEGLMPMLDGVSEEKDKRDVCNNIIQYLELRSKFLRERKLKDGIKVIKMKGNVGKRQVIFDWLLAYLT
ncbi:MAG: glycosyltransferase [Lachnospiraceae bacterium]|nr:glycosyltransferase [Lachnospiraceae bacterium]